MNTPTYLFYKNKIIENYKSFERLLPECKIYYALKANSEQKILSVLDEIGSNFDVASEEEFFKLINLGVSPERILCSLPVKPESLIEKLYRAGCSYFVFDHVEELSKLVEYASEAKKVLRIYTADMVKDDLEYGMTKEEFIQLKEKYPHLVDRIDGVTFYSKNVEEIEVFEKILTRCDFVLQNLDKHKELILNLGGSYQVNDRMNEDYYAKVNRLLNRLQNKHKLQLIAEPGRGIIDTAGVLLTRVVMVKEKDGHYDIYIDAGDPTGVFKRPTKISKYMGEVKETKRKKVYRFVGITCNHRVLFISPLKYEIKKNDILMLEGYGGYSICFSSNFHAWKKPQLIIEE